MRLFTDRQTRRALRERRPPPRQLSLLYIAITPNSQNPIDCSSRYIPPLLKISSKSVDKILTYTVNYENPLFDLSDRNLWLSTPKIYSLVHRAISHVPWKFHQNPFITFWVVWHWPFTFNSQYLNACSSCHFPTILKISSSSVHNFLSYTVNYEIQLFDLGDLDLWPSILNI